MDTFGSCRREWRQAGGHQPGKLSTSQAIHDPIPSPTVSASRKKQKLTHLVPPQSFTGPSQSFHQQTVAPSHQPSSSVAKRGAIPTPKGKKQKSVSFRFMNSVALFILNFLLFIYSFIYFPSPDVTWGIFSQTVPNFSS